MNRTFRLILLSIMLIAMFSFPVYANPKLDKKKVSINVGQTVQLTVKGTKKKVKWASTNTNVAAVNNKGFVTAKGAGKTMITARVAGKNLRCKVTVKLVPAPAPPKPVGYDDICYYLNGNAHRLPSGFSNVTTEEVKWYPGLTVTTPRGVTFGSDAAYIQKVYGSLPIYQFVPQLDKVYRHLEANGGCTDVVSTKTWSTEMKQERLAFFDNQVDYVVTYTTSDGWYGIRFYLNSNQQVVGICLLHF